MKKPSIRYINCSKCKIRCKQTWWNKLNTGYKCKRCNKEVIIKNSKEWQKYYNYTWKKQLKEIEKIHSLYHKFDKYFSKYEEKKIDFFGKKKKFKFRNGYKWNGFELMQKLEAFCNKNPDIEIVTCDDNHHMGAMMVLIPHRNENKYWGTSIIYACQDTIEPREFFLYPHHEKSLISALKNIKG